MMENKIEVLVVEDSPVAQLLLVHILNSNPRLHVQGTANNGEAALEFLKRNKPDVILMDIHMPGLDGYETTRRIMETKPMPIVICSASSSVSGMAANFRAMEVGAVALVAKPVGLGHPEYESMAAKLVETVMLMSEVRVVKRWPTGRNSNSPASDLSLGRPAQTSLQVVAIGASTGGPPVLETILCGLPRNFPLPLLIVQHIAAGFLPGLVEWIGQSSGFPVSIAQHGEKIEPGCAYFAPDGFHLGLSSSNQIALSRLDPENGLRPAVAHLFRSVAAVCGGRAVGVLLTGMGRDGADELKRLRDLGAGTIAQDAESSVVHGMPGAAIELNAAAYVLPPHKIAGMLSELAATNSRHSGPPSFSP